MKKALEAELLKMNDVEFRELEHRMQIASNLRDFVRKFNLEPKATAFTVGFTHDKLIRISHGAHNLDLHDICSLQKMYSDLETQRVQDQVKNQVGFPAYKNSVPIQYQNLIEALEKLQGADKAEITLAFPNFRRTFTRAEPEPKTKTPRK
jgi:hypothetical protein